MDETLEKMMMMMTTMQRLESVGERVLGDRVAGRLQQWELLYSRARQWQRVSFSLGLMFAGVS